MARLFTPQYKQRGRVAAVVVTMAAGAAPFVCGLLIVQMLPEDRGWAPATVAGLSFLAGALLPWAAQNVMGLAGNGTLRRRLQRLLAAEHPELDFGDALFVGFSPGERLHVWHGETSRDVGFLWVEPGGLVYYGDGYNWCLPRSFVDHVDISPPEGGMQRVLVRWHVPRWSGRTFSLEAREANTLRRAREATRELYRRLREWARGESEAEEPLAATLGLPPTDMSGGQVVEEPATGSCATILAVAMITLVTIWRVAGALFSYGLLYQAILWAGLISVVGALVTGYLLHYLQAWEAEQRKRRPGQSARGGPS